MWISDLMETDNNDKYLSTSMEKWMKGNAILETWRDIYIHDIQNLQPEFNHKDMQRKRAF